jgi:hypothetical protein
MLNARIFTSTALFVAIVAGPALAIDNPKPTVPSAGQIKVGPSKLSETECTQLGGKSWKLPEGSSQVCNSGRYCETTDQNGQKHAVCITKQ